MSGQYAGVMDWVKQWAQQTGVLCRASERGWGLLLPDGRQVAVTAHDGRFSLCTAPPFGAQARSPERLLHWQFEVPIIVSHQPSPINHQPLRMSATLPLEGLTEPHAFALLDALGGRCAGSNGDALAEKRRKDIALVRRRWERERGGVGVRERENALSLRCHLPDSALTVEVLAEPSGCGVRLRCDIIAAPFVELACAPALHRYLLTVNAHITMGGFALADDGSPTFCVLLPSPVSSAHVGHGIGSLFACHQRFARAVKTMATNVTVSSWWHRLNSDREGGES